MAELIVTERSNIVAIADAVRSKTETTNEMSLSEIVSGINSISDSSGGGATIDEWVGGTTYNVGDIVTYEGAYYICTATVGDLDYPQTNSSYWELLNADELGSYKGGYLSTETYKVNDIVTLDGNVYRCINGGQGFDPSNYLGMYWEQLNTASSGDSSGGSSTVTLPTGTTYTLNNSSPYNSNFMEHPYDYTITEVVNCTYNDSAVYYIKLSGYGGYHCPNAPATVITLYDSTNSVIASFDGYNLNSSAISITISSNTQVSSLFYSVLTGMMG